MISVVIPAYNESARLPPTLERMRRYLDGAAEEYEVLVVDDGSQDGTAEVAESLAAEWPQARVLRCPANRGKGAAVRAGMLAARGELRLFSDADLSTPMAELPALRRHLDAQHGVAIASRALPGTTIEVHQNRRRETMGRIYNRILRLLVLPGIQDSQCGFKLFTAEAAMTLFEPLRTNRFGFDAEVLVRARRAGIGIAEVPVRWRHVEESRVSSLRDASRMLFDLLLLRLRGV
ncbi:MAG: glycosyltransferase family 2 protein [Candidatus Dormibacteria bacterium]